MNYNFDVIFGLIFQNRNMIVSLIIDVINMDMFDYFGLLVDLRGGKYICC